MSAQLEEIIIYEVYNRIKKDIKSGNIDKDDYISIIAGLMTIVDNYNGLSGQDKKAVVVKVINDLIAESNEPIMKQILTPTTVSNLIDIIVKVAKGEIKIGKKINKIKKALNCCK